MSIDRERLLERFLRYVQIDTTARDLSVSSEPAPYPSSPGQKELGAIVADELRAIGLADVTHSEHGIVMATVPPTIGSDHAQRAVVALNAHLDTSPETTGLGVKPQVIRNYDGRDLALPGKPSLVLRPSELPELQGALGHTLITTDGTTLLGGDDKAGVAAIVETAAHLMENPDLPHGPIRLCFTCDEEIGRGVDYVDLTELGAHVAYTLDGGGAGEIDVETFSADLAVITVRGANIHPAIAKDRMINSLRGAAWFLSLLPAEFSPERTSDRQGFVHPYTIEGGVAQTTIRVLLRDFETPRLEYWASLLRQTALAAQTHVPGVRIDVAIRRQYRNMADSLAHEPRAVALAERAFAMLGRTCERTLVRGGTDGSRFTELGLPTPNLSSGQHNIHSPLEWASLDQMTSGIEVLIVLLGLWASEPAQLG